MKPSDVERWAAEIVGAVERGVRREDDRVELKRQPKESPIENARRIAGHANQVREGHVLWIFGLDEDGTRHPLPPSLADPNEWWQPIAACFDDVAPSPVFASLGGLLAVGFDTERLPFVIRHPNGIVSREVPWREGTRVRSASRFDLLKLLVPVARLPQLTVLWGFVNVIRKDPIPGRTQQLEPIFEWSLRVRLYADTVETFVAPDHRLRVQVTFAGAEDAVVFEASTGDGNNSLGEALAVTGGGQLMVSGPSPFMIHGRATSAFDGPPVIPGSTGRLRIDVGLNGGRSTQATGALGAAEAQEAEYSQGGYELVPVAGWRVEADGPEVAA